MATKTQEFLTHGKFGQAIRVQRAGIPEISAPFREEYQQLPVTIECWARVDVRDREYNVLLSNGARMSATYWELYAQKEGCLGFALQGYNPGYAQWWRTEVNSTRLIADGAWHFLAVTWDGHVLALFENGEEVLRQEMTRRDDPQFPNDRGLYFGCQTFSQVNITCGGALKEARIALGRVDHRVGEEPPDAHQSEKRRGDDPHPGGGVPAGQHRWLGR